MEKTTKNGIHRITQAGGKTIAWAEESGVKVLEKDGYYFKDLAKTGELLPYEDWRLSDEERAADLAGRLSIEEIAGPERKNSKTVVAFRVIYTFSAFFLSLT